LFALRYLGGFGKPELPAGGLPESGPGVEPVSEHPGRRGAELRGFAAKIGRSA